MNLVKNVMEETLSKVGVKAFMPASHKVKLAKGLCITCDNRSHCIWRQNAKTYCQHFQ